MVALVINLDRDTDRLERFRSNLPAEFPLVRLPGVAGSELPLNQRILLCGNVRWASKAGEIGCFLSHFKAWEYCSKCRDPYCIVMEDDAIPFGLAKLHISEMPNDFDIIFINDRMSGGGTSNEPEGPLKFLSVAASLASFNARGKGVGGDGYVISPVGASKLVKAVVQDGFFGHVDWRLLRYCLHPEDLEGELSSSFVAEVVMKHHNPNRPPAWGVVKGYCVNAPLVRHGKGESARTRETNLHQAV